MSDRYILNDAGEPVPCDDLLTWARWYEDGARRIVAQTSVEEAKAFECEIVVSTVFLAIDHNFFGRGDPILWESMIFGPEGFPLTGEQRRYSSREAAETGHTILVEMARELLRRMQASIEHEHALDAT